MPITITPFASGSVLSTEQGGTGIDADSVAQGQLIGGLGSGALGAIDLTAGANITLDKTVPGQITISSGGAVGISAAIKSVIANYAALVTDYTILVDATAGNVNITIPQINNSIWNIKKIDASANTVTITPASGTIDGAASIVNAVRWVNYTVQSDGVNLYIL